MKDRLYKENTKSTFSKVKAWLYKLGYKETRYGDSATYADAGYAYLEKPGVSLKLTYHWVHKPTKCFPNRVVSGTMIALEDMSSCYSVVMGKETGYR